MNSVNDILCGWLDAGKYRVILHRHDGTWRATDEAEHVYVDAPSKDDLAYRIQHNWFQKY